MSVTVTEEQAFTACACHQYAAKLAGRPYSSVDAFLTAARNIWFQNVSVTGWLEAFAAHPRIGDIEGLRKKYGAFADLSKGEQAAAAATISEEVLRDLAAWNKKYEDKFGHIFIICAKGKTAPEMLAAVQARYGNAPAAELTIAAAEQMKITELRLRDMLQAPAGTSTGSLGGPQGPSPAPRRTSMILSHLTGATPSSAPSGGPAGPRTRSPITTHMLDTAIGKPAEGVAVQLHYGGDTGVNESTQWQFLAAGSTNKDGRIGDLLPASHDLRPGNYRIAFDTNSYMARCKALFPNFFSDRPFYPIAEIYFSVAPHQVNEHFHVPLTWNPYGYSTYRGS